MIEKMDESRRYEILDLWSRCTIAANPFLEANFWQKNYDEAKAKFLTGCQNYIYTDGARVVAFICVSDNNYINGLFVDPEYRGRGIGRELVEYVKKEYSSLWLNIYAKSHKMLDFASSAGFLISGAVYQEESRQVKYKLVWKQNTESE